jgi:hypothetical protein
MLLNPMKNRSDALTKPSPFVSLVYLSAFMMHFGAQMWMTFVSGDIKNILLFYVNNIKIL